MIQARTSFHHRALRKHCENGEKEKDIHLNSLSRDRDRERERERENILLEWPWGKNRVKENMTQFSSQLLNSQGLKLHFSILTLLALFHVCMSHTTNSFLPKAAHNGLHSSPRLFNHYVTLFLWNFWDATKRTKAPAVDVHLVLILFFSLSLSLFRLLFRCAGVSRMKN